MTVAVPIKKMDPMEKSGLAPLGEARFRSESLGKNRSHVSIIDEKINLLCRHDTYDPSL